MESHSESGSIPRHLDSAEVELPTGRGLKNRGNIINGKPLEERFYSTPFR